MILENLGADLVTMELNSKEISLIWISSISLVTKLALKGYIKIYCSCVKFLQSSVVNNILLELAVKLCKKC
jgi:hypothetical protein